MKNPFVIKAKRYNTLKQLERALQEINETLKLQFSSGDSYEASLVQQLLNQRDAYLTQVADLQNSR